MDKNTEDGLLLKALDMAEKHYSKNEIFEVLRGAEEFEKPVAILDLEEISSDDEAGLLLAHLTGCDGRIREAAANKISEFLKSEEISKLFLNDFAAEIILNGIMDINPNVGRALGAGIGACGEFQEILLPKLIKRIERIIEELKHISDTPYRENKLNNKRNHAKNKIVFNLYWGLETLSLMKFKGEDIKNILNFTSCYTDYTIREKCAKILSVMDNPPSELLQKLKNDENFYVKTQLL